MRWTDCEDDEGEKNKEQETQEARQEEAESKKEQEAERKQEQEQEQEGGRKKEQEEGAWQREMTDRRPPGLEEVESEPKTQGEEEQSQVESK